MNRFVENPPKSVLCVGHISPKRHVWEEMYNERLLTIYRHLSSQGFNTYLITEWNKFTALAMQCLKRNKPDLIRDYGLEFVYSMGIFDVDRSAMPEPSYHDVLDEVLVPQEDDDSLTSDEVLDTVLSEVSVVLFDNQDDDSFISSILYKARALGKRMIDVNSHP